MKKSLIALAVLAAAGVASAQTVNLTGAVAFGYKTASTAGVTSNGFGTDTSEIAISVSEDLGGGTKLSAGMGLEGFARDFAVGALNQTIVLSGGFGSVLLGSIEIGDGIRGLAQAGAPVNNMEKEILNAATNNDIIKYTSPAMGGLKLSGSFVEAAAADGTGITNAGVAATTIITLGADYAVGPVAAKFDYSNYSNPVGTDHRYRIAGSYDFGAAKVGLGHEDFTTITSTHNKFTMLGVSAPLGATTVGAAYVKKTDTAGVDTSGYTIGASYALSKRTSISSNYAKWDNATASQDSKFNLLLNHSF